LLPLFLRSLDLTSPSLSLPPNIDIPLRTQPVARSAPVADLPDTSFAQTLKERAERPDQADSTVDQPEATDSAPDAQIETTDSADEAQNEPVDVKDGEGADAAAAGDKLDQEQTAEESSPPVLAPTIEVIPKIQADVVQPVAVETPSETAAPASPVSPVPVLVDEQPINTKPASEQADGLAALQTPAKESPGAKIVDAEGAPILASAQPTKTDVATLDAADATSNEVAPETNKPTDSAKAVESAAPVNTPTAPSMDAKDKSKADTIQQAPTSQGDGSQSAAAGRVSAVEGAQASPDSTFQNGQRQQTEPILRTAERNTLTQAEPEAPSANQRLFNATVSRGLEAAMRQKGGAITIRLKPDSLGSLRIELQINQGTVAAQFQATTQKARDLLHENMSSLRTSLEAKGFGVKSVEVQVQASSPGERTSGEFGRSSEDAAGQAPTQDSGANGQAPSRQEDPDDFPYLNQDVDPFTEVESVDTGWQTVRAGGVNTIA
jgi:flagellar hook-length control protein FliK